MKEPGQITVCVACSCHKFRPNSCTESALHVAADVLTVVLPTTSVLSLYARLNYETFVGMAYSNSLKVYMTAYDDCIYARVLCNHTYSGALDKLLHWHAASKNYLGLNNHHGNATQPNRGMQVHPCPTVSYLAKWPVLSKQLNMFSLY